MVVLGRVRDLEVAALQVAWQQPSGLKHRQDAHARRRDAIDNAIIPVDHFADILPLKFGDDAAGQRESLQTIDRGQQLIEEEVGVMWGVARDEPVNLAKVVACGDDPLDQGLGGIDHARRSACGTVSGRIGV